MDLPPHFKALKENRKNETNNSIDFFFYSFFLEKNLSEFKFKLNFTNCKFV